MGNQEIKTSNITKSEIIDGLSLRITTPSCACVPVLEVEQDVPLSGISLDSTLFDRVSV